MIDQAFMVVIAMGNINLHKDVLPGIVCIGWFINVF
jgi:hypothetical protein